MLPVADESDLLYEDLFENLENGQAVIKTSFHELEERIQQLRNESEEMRLQVGSLQVQNEKLSKQNDVLIRNISCLFKTAQLEISRKDKQIRSLQEEMLTLDVGCGSRPLSSGTQLGRESCPSIASQTDRKSRTSGSASLSVCGIRKRVRGTGDRDVAAAEKSKRKPWEMGDDDGGDAGEESRREPTPSPQENEQFVTSGRGEMRSGVTRSIVPPRGRGGNGCSTTVGLAPRPRISNYCRRSYSWREEGK